MRSSSTRSAKAWCSIRQSRAEAERWLAQAESDLAFDELGLRGGFFAQACFMCQQAADKALKGLHYLGGARVVLGHSVVELLDGLTAGHPALRGVREVAQQLDQYYIPPRYPNGLPAGAVPSAVFTKRQADDALAGAQAISDIAGVAIRQHRP
ncbi:MAG: HEPN domain-containing protein [Candidatus Rokuibacteriota bacterium]